MVQGLCAAREEPFSGRYIWSDSVWESTDIPCLRGISQRDGSVGVNFFSNQPALNYGYAKRTRPWMAAPDSPDALATREAMKDVMRFWLDMGGGRLPCGYGGKPCQGG